MMQPHAMSTLPTVTLVVALLAPASPVAQDAKADAARVRSVVSLSATASAQIAQRVLRHPDLPQRAAGHRLVAIRVTAESIADASGNQKTMASVVLFDHTALEARRVVIDQATDRLLSNERLSGRPQRSDGELTDAIAVLRRDPILGRLLDAGAVLDGGFIVDDPGGSRRRMIQLKLLRADRRALLRSILVDLTRGEIASISETHGGR